jgi:hypothetical protein
MNKLTKDQIIMEFEIATQHISEEVSTINVEILKKAAKNDHSMNRCCIEICLELMQILTQELKLKSTIQHKEVEILSEDEKYFLESINK